MAAFLRFLRQVAHFLLVLLILCILLLLLLVIGLPSYLYRLLIARIAARWAPDLGKMLTTMSSLPGVDDITGQPKQSLVIYFIVRGDCDFERGLKYFQERATEPRTSRGQFLFPEMRQYVVRWCGFLFWKWDPHFDIYNHVRVAQEDQLTEDEYYARGSELTYAPFKAERSPWEILVFPGLQLEPENYPDADAEDVRGPHFGVMMRAHHTLADGFSLTRMLNVDFGGKETINVQTSNFVPVAPRLSLWRRTAYLFKAPYDFVSESVRAADGITSWHVAEAELKREHNSCVSPAISMTYIKEIKNQHGVSFTAVLISAFTGAIRRFMDEAASRGGAGGTKYVRPRRVHCIHPLPMPAHPTKLRNHMTACFIQLPIEIQNPQSRVAAIDEDLTRAKGRTLYPIAMYYYMRLMGALPAGLISLLARNTLCTAFMSNFPGDNTELVVAGFPLRSMYFAGGFTAGNIGMGFASISYNGYLRIVAGVDSGLVGTDVLDARVFIEFFMQELDALAKTQSTKPQIV